MTTWITFVSRDNSGNLYAKIIGLKTKGMSLLGVKGQRHVLLIEKAQTHVLS